MIKTLIILQDISKTIVGWTQRLETEPFACWWVPLYLPKTKTKLEGRKEPASFSLGLYRAPT